MMKISIRQGRRRQHRWLTATFLGTALALVVGLAQGSAAQTPAEGQKQAVVSVKGLQCPFCAYGIRKHLAKLPGADKVEVELAKSRAIVTFAPDATVTDEQIQQAIRKAGFTPGEIEWRSPGEGEQARNVRTTKTTGERPARP